MSERERVAYVIAFSAPPVLHLADFLRFLHTRGWDTHVILSPTAASWVDVAAITEVAGHAVRIEPRGPRDPDPLPPADAVVAAPLTFNSLNKWATGISDTLALGLLNETLGLGLPVSAALCIKDALRKHPVYAGNVARLAAAGATIFDSADLVIRSAPDSITLDWARVLPA